MESNITPNPQYKQITVDVPEDRVDEFNRFVARFLEGPSRGRRGGRHGRHGHGRHGHEHHGRGCGDRRERVEGSQSAETTSQSAETTEI
jgi:hypothetical protein